MTIQEIRNDIYDALAAKYEDAEPRVFVGIQGDDRVVLMQAGGEHFGVVVVPAKVEVAG